VAAVFLMTASLLSIWLLLTKSLPSGAIVVALIVLRPEATERVSGFVRISLDMRAPYGLAAPASIITATPGSLWVEYDTADNTMLLQILDLIDGEEWGRIIKDRYERRLMEIFE
jgi:multicomponent K+:H+ antiporter subunit E